MLMFKTFELKVFESALILQSIEINEDIGTECVYKISLVIGERYSRMDQVEFRICGIQPLKKLKWYGLLKQSAYCLLQFTHRTLFQIKLSKFHQKFEMNLKYRSSTGKKSWFWSPFFKGCKTAVFKAVVEIEENLKYLPGPFQKIMVHF